MSRSASASYPSLFVEAECTIMQQIAPTAYRANLPNGKETIAFLQRREAETLGPLFPGEKVRAVINPADFDRARICSRI